VDVEPLFNRLVVFPSDYYHEVLPAHFKRKALTLWCYSKKDLHAVLRPRFSHLIPTTETEIKSARIFVSICSYRDPECGPTVEDLFYKATFPDRLRVGINWQYSEQEDVKLFNACSYYGKKYAKQIREIRMPHDAAKGPVFARALIQQYLYDGEDFYLQIDSHMRFEKGWDVRLVQMLQQVEHTCGKKGKCVLSTYPPGYELPNEIPDSSQITLLTASRFTSEKVSVDFSYEMLRLAGKSVMLECNHPLPSYFWAAGFSFSRGSFVTDVPYDQSLEYVFFGEELIMAIRMFAKGYQIFAPNEIIVHHLWRRDYRKNFRENELTNQTVDALDSVDQPENIVSVMPLVSSVEHVSVDPENLRVDSPEEILKKKVRNLRGLMVCFGMCSEEGQEISGNSAFHPIKQSLADFEKCCGVNFSDRLISDTGQNGGFELFQYLL